MQVLSYLKTMKKIIYLLILIPFFCFASGNFHEQSDTIVWSGNIELDADQFFTQQETLKILPGTVVTASGPYKIEIRGNIIAEGTAENPILFTATDTLGLYDSATIAGGWHGFHLLDNDTGIARFVHCRFEYGKANIPGSWFEDQGQFDNLSGNQGGAFRITGYHSTEFKHCTFFYNYARSKGGGIYCHDIQSMSISDCDFSQNKVMVSGGAIFCGSHLNLLIDHCMFKLNISWSKTVSGTIFCHGSAVYLDSYPPNAPNMIKNNYFFNNYSLSTFANFTSGSSLINNVFANNYNSSVITLNRLESTHIVFNNIIANNFYVRGIPGVFNFSRDLHFYNNIMWDNLSDTIGDNDMAIIGMLPDVQYCLVWQGRIDGTNILTDDPLFVNPAPGYGMESNGWEYDWSLSNASPAVNAGTPDTTGLNLPEFDIAGNPRFYGIRIDMGAYENQVVVGLPKNPLVNSKIEIIPNPFKDSFSINLFGENKISRISVLNQSGITIRKMEQLPTDGFMLIDLNGYTSGLYLVVVEYADGTRKVEKVLKQ
jgi:predicted outer membrane repeat protein